jgi:hypothetical protein
VGTSPETDGQSRSKKISALDALAREGATPGRLLHPRYEPLTELAARNLDPNGPAATRRVRELFHAMYYIAATAQQHAARNEGLPGARPEVVAEIAAAAELLGFSDDTLLAQKLGEKYESHKKAEEDRSPWAKRSRAASAWMGVSLRTLYRHLNGQLWPIFLDALEQRLAGGFEEPDPADAKLPEDREPLRSFYRAERRAECDLLLPALLDLRNELIDAVELVREPKAGVSVRDTLLNASSLKVHGSFQIFHSSLHKLVLRNMDAGRRDRYLLILSDAEFGERIADGIYGIYMSIPINLMEQDGWLHRLLTRYGKHDILRTFQTASGMPSTGAGQQVYDQWLQLLLGCECENDDHIREKCQVHTLIRIVDETYQAIEGVRLRQLADSA